MKAVNVVSILRVEFGGSDLRVVKGGRKEGRKTWTQDGDAVSSLPWVG